MRRVDKLRNTLHNEYANVEYEETFYNKIKEIYNVDPKILRNDPNQIFLVLDNSKRIDITASLEKNVRISIDRIATVGTILVKESNSYTFFLNTISAGDTIKYEFELCDSEGYELKRKTK